MFTLTQLLLEERLVYGVISDVLYFGSLYWGHRRAKALKERDESRTEALKDMHSHLDTFLSMYETNEAPSYEAWIADLHPENTTVSKNGTITVDPRMYLIDSDHRVMWNEHAQTNEIQEVQVRDFRKEESLPHNRDPKDTPS